MAKLTLRNADVLHGRLTDEKWAVNSGIGEVQLAAGDVAGCEFNPDSLGHVKIALNNGTSIGGKLAGDYVGFKVEPGPALKIFVGKIATFAGAKPSGEPSTSTRPAARESGPAEPGEVAELSPRRAEAEAARIKKRIAELLATKATVEKQIVVVNEQIAKGGDVRAQAEFAKVLRALQDKLVATDAKIRKLQEIEVSPANRR